MGWAPQTVWGTSPNMGAGSDGGAAGGAGVPGQRGLVPAKHSSAVGGFPQASGVPSTRRGWEVCVGHLQRLGESSPCTGMLVSLRNPSLGRGWCSWSPQPEHPLELPSPWSPTAMKMGQKLWLEPFQQKEERRNQRQSASCTSSRKTNPAPTIHRGLFSPRAGWEADGVPRDGAHPGVRLGSGFDELCTRETRTSAAPCGACSGPGAATPRTHQPAAKHHQLFMTELFVVQRVHQRL